VDYDIASSLARPAWRGIRRPAWAARLADAARSGPFAVRNFRLLSFGQSTSTIGDYCYLVALPWLILSGHGGTVLLGAVLACYGVPRTVLIPVGGVLSDRFGPRTVMLASDAGRCVLMALLAVLAARRTESLVALGPIAALLGAGEGVFVPASFSIMPRLLPADQLPAGNAMANALIRVGSLAGPVIGGLLVAPLGPAPAFAVDAASFAASTAALAMIRTGTSARPAPSDRRAGSQDRSPGTWQLLRRSRVLQIMLGVAIVANLTAGGTFEVAMPALAHARYGASGYGVLLACFGAGAVAGTLTGARMGALRRPAVVACTGFVVEAAALCLMPLLGGLAGTATALVVAGLCNGFGNVVLFTLLQQRAPAASLGRVMSLLMLAGMGSVPVSVAIAGLLVRHLSATAFFFIAGIALGVAVLAALSQREMREFGTADLTELDDPAPNQAAPARGDDPPEPPETARLADASQAAVLVR
jgi:MFS family permease